MTRSSSLLALARGRVTRTTLSLNTANLSHDKTCPARRRAMTEGGGEVLGLELLLDRGGGGGLSIKNKNYVMF